MAWRKSLHRKMLNLKSSAMSHYEEVVSESESPPMRIADVQHLPYNVSYHSPSPEGMTVDNRHLEGGDPCRM